MNFTVSVKIDEQEIKRTVNTGVKPTVRGVTFAIDAMMKLLMTEPKSGTAYTRGGRTHIASAPGEAPAVDTGFLINSIQTRIISDTEAEIIIPAEYAEALEFGTADLAARPFVRPAIDSVLKDFGRGGILAGLRN